MKKLPFFSKKAAIRSAVSGTLIIIAGLVLDFFIGITQYGSAPEVGFNFIYEVAEDTKGNYFVLDEHNDDFYLNTSYLYHFNPDTRQVDFTIDKKNFSYMSSCIENFCLDENDDIYTASYNSNNLSDYSLIISHLSSEGKLIKELVEYHLDEIEIVAMHVNEGSLEYLLYNHKNSTIQIVSVDIKTETLKVISEISNKDGYFTLNACYCQNGDYIIISKSSELITLHSDGTTDIFYRPDYNVYDYLQSINLRNGVTSIDNVCYSIAGFNRQLITAVSNGKSEVVCNSLNLLDEKDFPNIYEMYSSVRSYYNVYSIGGKLGFSSVGNLNVMTDDGIASYNAVIMPHKFIEIFYVYMSIMAVAGILLIFSILYFICYLIKLRHYILFKMLIMIIPLTCTMLIAFINTITGNIKETYLENVQNDLFMISDLSIDKFDGDDLKTMTDFSIIDDGRYDKLTDCLNNISRDNFTAIIYLCIDEGMWISPDSENGSPFSEIFFIGCSSDEDDIYSDYSETYIHPVYNILSLDTPISLTAFTPIYDKNHKKTAMLAVSSDLDVINMEIEEMQAQTIGIGLLFMLIITVIEVLVSLYIVRNLRRANAAIINIANGDFSSKISKTSNDELGQICSSVNTMAVQLQNFFDEKDKNTEFYYKFVPEKFKELLHKNDLTELALGDAESKELTVLFCDIRSFSLNSEMMTAKENFEFVNIIYGKAGPIIRENNGFVDKYIGDAVMALFESADSAVKAGIELYKEIVLDGTVSQLLGIGSINIGIGIHTGMARIGIVGESERLAGTVISNTVNLASRLESLTKQYKTAMIITKETLDKLSDPDSLNARYLGMVQVAGVNEVKALYEILDALDEQQREIRMENKLDFREAIRLFHMGQVQESLLLLEKIKNEKSDSDPVVDKYISYIKEKIDTGDTKHNIFQFSRK